MPEDPATLLGLLALAGEADYDMTVVSIGAMEEADEQPESPPPADPSQ